MKRWLLWLGLAAPALAQLAPGDELEIRLFALPEIGYRYRIAADGSLNHPIAGRMQAAGLSLTDLETRLQWQFQMVLKNPRFDLRLRASTAARLSAPGANIIGEVRNQGRYAIGDGLTVGELLERAGPNGRADGIVLQGAGQKREVSLDEAVRDGDLVTVEPGHFLLVSGEVERPGPYMVSRKSADPLGEALRLAGVKSSGALARLSVSQRSDADIVYVPPMRCVLVVPEAPKQIVLSGHETLGDVVPALETAGQITLDRNEERSTFDGRDSETGGVAVRDGDVIFVGVKPPAPVGAQRFRKLPYSLLLYSEPFYYWKSTLSI